MAISRHIRIAAALLAAMASFGFGKIARPTPYDPVLTGAPPGPCDPDLAGADVVDGVDVQGNPVAPADLPRTNRLGAVDVPELTVRVKRPHGNDVYVNAANLTPPRSCSR